MSSSPLSPRLAKGAFVEFSDRFTLPTSVPNVIVFQYNPSTMTRKLEGWKEESTDKEKSSSESATAQPFDPGETFNFKLELDAADVLDEPLTHPLAVISGVSDRIAAIELLLYPQQKTDRSSLLGSAAATLGGAAVSSAGVGFASGGIGAAAGIIGSQLAFNQMSVTQLEVPRGTVPTVLFAWSPGRLVPVRITGFSVEEIDYTNNLYPLRANITLDLKILAPKNIPCSNSAGDKKAITAYNIYQRQKRDFAAANLLNSGEYGLSELVSRLL